MQEKNSGKEIYILSFDLEEWFHILDVESLDSVRSWDRYESRIRENTFRILEILKENKWKASFFILGWVARRYPELVRIISDQGYEIGTHSMNHLLIYKISRDRFREDLRKSIHVLEDISGKKVRNFRAPGFSIKKESLWAFEILAEEGIEIDSSIFPASRGHGGIKDFEFDHPFRIRTAGGSIKEFPMNVHRIWKFKIPFSGGGYFRVLPYYILKKLTQKSDYMMTYFHPRDFDAGQPVLKQLPLLRIFKSYWGLKKSQKKLLKWLKCHSFMDISTADQTVSWDNTPEFHTEELKS